MLTILPRLDTETPLPDLDAMAAARWRRRVPEASPWLHEEVGRRMAERLDWIKQQPAVWLDWEPLRGGLEAHRRVRERYPQADALIDGEAPEALLRDWGARKGWRWNPLARRRERLPRGDETVDLLWANMALHGEDRPQARLAQWHRRVAVGGFLMFACLGPDTLRELRVLHATQGWPPPTQGFVDMHDWGDQLVHTGFAEPVMDMERIVLTFATPERLLQELRGLGRNLHPQRFAGLRARGWARRYREVLERELPRADDGQLQLTFEVIYGHAFKAAPRIRGGEPGSISLQDMRAMLRGGAR